MITQRFAPGKQISWRGETFEVVRLLPDRQAQLENIFSGAMLTAPLNKLYADLYDGSLEFVLDGKGVKKSKDNQPATEVKYLQLDRCAPELLAEADLRLKAIQPLLDLEKRTRQNVIDRVREIKACPEYASTRIGVTTLYTLIHDYERSGRDKRALIPDTDERGGKGGSRTDETVERIINEVIDEFNARVTTMPQEKKTTTDIWLEVCRRIKEENAKRFANEQLGYPALTTIQRRIDELDIRAVFAKRQGTRAAEKAFAQYGKGPEAERPGERIEIDHTKLDLIVIDEQDNLPLGRLTLTDCLDVCTRYPLGFYLGFEPPSYYAVMECLYHAILPKHGLKEKYSLQHDWQAHGIPAALITDNGKEFIGHSLEAACRDLDITLEQMPVKKPHFKGKIERLFRSITFVVHGLPGTTFANARERGDYDSPEMACLYLGDVQEILARFLVDIYAERLHRGIQAVPARRWEASLANGFLPRVPASADKLRILLGQTAFRSIQPAGIEFECLHYNTSGLGDLRHALKGQDVEIKIHPGDLSQIYLYNPFTRDYLTVPAVDPTGYTTGLSLWKHRVIHRRALELRDKVDLGSLGEAKYQIQQVVNEARQRATVTQRAKLARWERGGQPPSLADRPQGDMPALPPPALPAPPSEPAPGWPVLEFPKGTLYDSTFISLPKRGNDGPKEN